MSSPQDAPVSEGTLKPLPTLRTDRLILRPFRMEDAATVQRLAGAWEVADTTLTIPHPYLDGMAETWIGTHVNAWERRELVTLAITLGADEVVGAVALRLTLKHRRAELGYWVGRPFWNRGYATEAVRAILTFGFETLDLNRIHASHLVRNPASGRVMAKAGMRFEGTRRQHFVKAGRAEDVAEYAILRADIERG